MINFKKIENINPENLTNAIHSAIGFTIYDKGQLDSNIEGKNLSDEFKKTIGNIFLILLNSDVKTDGDLKKKISEMINTNDFNSKNNSQISKLKENLEKILEQDLSTKDAARFQDGETRKLDPKNDRKLVKEDMFLDVAEKDGGGQMGYLSLKKILKPLANHKSSNIDSILKKYLTFHLIKNSKAEYITSEFWRIFFPNLIKVSNLENKAVAIKYNNNIHNYENFDRRKMNFAKIDFQNQPKLNDFLEQTVATFSIAKLDNAAYNFVFELDNENKIINFKMIDFEHDGGANCEEFKVNNNEPKSIKDDFISINDNIININQIFLNPYWNIYEKITDFLNFRDFKDQDPEKIWDQIKDQKVNLYFNNYFQKKTLNDVSIETLLRIEKFHEITKESNVSFEDLPDFRKYNEIIGNFFKSRTAFKLNRIYNYYSFIPVSLTPYTLLVRYLCRKNNCELIMEDQIEDEIINLSHETVIAMLLKSLNNNDIKPNSLGEAVYNFMNNEFSEFKKKNDEEKAKELKDLIDDINRRYKMFFIPEVKKFFTFRILIDTFNEEEIIDSFLNVAERILNLNENQKEDLRKLKNIASDNKYHLKCMDLKSAQKNCKKTLETIKTQYNHQLSERQKEKIDFYLNIKLDFTLEIQPEQKIENIQDKNTSINENNKLNESVKNRDDINKKNITNYINIKSDLALEIQPDKKIENIKDENTGINENKKLNKPVKNSDNMNDKSSSQFKYTSAKLALFVVGIGALSAGSYFLEKKLDNFENLKKTEKFLIIAATLILSSIFVAILTNLFVDSFKSKPSSKIDSANFINQSNNLKDK